MRKMTAQYGQRKVEEKPPEPTMPVSEEELALLRLVMNSFTNKEAAKKLKKDERTITSHLSSLFRRFSVFDRTSLVVQALRHHVLSFGDATSNDLVLSQEALMQRRAKYTPPKKAAS